MHIVYSDDNDRLTPEIWKLMEQAGDRALENEFGEELRATCTDPVDIEPELGVTIVDADEILVLKDGTIVERGSHRELIDAHGKYAKMYIRQAMNYLAVEKEEEVIL